MTPVQGIVAKLLATAGVTALVAQRIRTTQADETDTLPYVLLFIVSDGSEYHMAGEAGLARCRLQVDCWGASPLEALDVSEAVRAALSGFRGLAGTVQIRRCHRIDRNGPELFGPVNASQKGKYRVRMDFSIDYHESV